MRRSLPCGAVVGARREVARRGRRCRGRSAARWRPPAQSVGVLQADRLRGLLLEADERIGLEVAAHAGQRAGQLRLHADVEAAALDAASRGSASAGAATGSANGAVELRERRLQHAHRHRGGDELRHLQPVLRAAAALRPTASQAMLNASAGTSTGQTQLLRAAGGERRRPAPAARSACARSRAPLAPGRFAVPCSVARTFISRAVVLRSVSIALKRSPSRTSGGRPGEHLQVLRDADAGAAGAELLHAGVGDGDQAEARQRIVERHLDRRLAVGVERRRCGFQSSSVSNSSRVAPRPPPPPAATALRP